MELIPEGVFFREDLFKERSLADLEDLLVAGLEKYGRVANDTGILVTHGTDTMAWGFAYLRYALRDLKANVAMTGSQIPLGGYFSDSDALGNLRTAAFLLNRLRPARLFAVFNDGRSVFSGRLTKYRKWGEDAFEGRVIASGPSGEVRPLRKDWVYIPYADQRLKHLHLIRTGGTIESQREAGSAEGLKPTGDFVWKFLTGSLGEFFEEARRHDLFALDSSNMSFEEWAQLARAIESIGAARADTRFDPTVKPVFCNPLFTADDYRAQFAACGRGSILAGYGGGNAHVREDSMRSILPSLRAAVHAGTFVAVTSQVPLEDYDAEYESGLALLEAGGVPCGDLPLADAQVKLSYLLGHGDLLAQTASDAGLDEQSLLAAAFLSGVSMRHAGSLNAFRHAGGRSIPARVLPYDPFAIKTFDEAIRSVAASLTS
jgi:L-asparaginase/Glu-tRNA(Gln) amidotransferase subunit D